MVELYPGLNKPATLPLAISEQELMLTGDADIGLKPATINPTTQVDVVYC